MRVEGEKDCLVKGHFIVGKGLSLLRKCLARQASSSLRDGVADLRAGMTEFPFCVDEFASSRKWLGDLAHQMHIAVDRKQRKQVGGLPSRAARIYRLVGQNREGPASIDDLAAFRSRTG